MAAAPLRRKRFSTRCGVPPMSSMSEKVRVIACRSFRKSTRSNAGESLANAEGFPCKLLLRRMGNDSIALSRYPVWRRVGYQERQPDLRPVLRPCSRDRCRDRFCRKRWQSRPPAKVLVGLTDATRTPARQAILQMAGPTGISPAMTAPLRYRQAPIRPASPLLGHRTPIRIASIFADAVKLIPVVHATTQVSPPFPEWAEKNRCGTRLHLEELKRPQRRITNVANC